MQRLSFTHRFMRKDFCCWWMERSEWRIQLHRSCRSRERLLGSYAIYEVRSVKGKSNIQNEFSGYHEGLKVICALPVPSFLLPHSSSEWWGIILIQKYLSKLECQRLRILIRFTMSTSGVVYLGRQLRSSSISVYRRISYSIPLSTELIDKWISLFMIFVFFSIWTEIMIMHVCQWNHYK